MEKSFYSKERSVVERDAEDVLTAPIGTAFTATRENLCHSTWGKNCLGALNRLRESKSSERSTAPITSKKTREEVKPMDPEKMTRVGFYIHPQKHKQIRKWCDQNNICFDIFCRVAVYHLFTYLTIMPGEQPRNLLKYIKETKI